MGTPEGYVVRVEEGMKVWDRGQGSCEWSHTEVKKGWREYGTLRGAAGEVDVGGKVVAKPKLGPSRTEKSIYIRVEAGTTTGLVKGAKY